MGSNFNVQRERLGFLEVERSLLVQAADWQFRVVQRDFSPEDRGRVGNVHPPPTDTPGGESSEGLVGRALGEYSNDELCREVGDGCWPLLGGLGGELHGEGGGRNLGDKGQEPTRDMTEAWERRHWRED